MKNLFVIVLLLCSFSLFGQDVVLGGGGLVHTNADPDDILDLQLQDARYEAMLAYDTIGRQLYVYDGSQVLGNRWANIPLSAVTDTDTRLAPPTVTANVDGTTTISFPIFDEINSTNTGGLITYNIPRAPIQSIVNGTNVLTSDDGNGNITINVVIDLESTFTATGNGEITLNNEGSTNEIDLVGGTGIDLEQVSSSRYRIGSQIYTEITAVNYSNAASQGVQINEWFIASESNSMGAIPGTFIKRLF